MRLPEENEYSNSGLFMKYMAVGVGLCLLLIVGTVIWTNKAGEAKKRKEAQESQVLVLEHGEDTAGGGQTGNSQNENAGTKTVAGGNSGNGQGGTAQTGNTAANVPGTDASVKPSANGPVMNFNGTKPLEEVERLYAENKLVASDLDFWDMYPKNTPSGMGGAAAGTAGNAAGSQNGGENGSSDGEPYARYDEEAEREARKEEEKEEQDPSRDGKHTKVTLANGEEEWVLINPYLEKNTYDYTKLKMKNDLASYADGNTFSYVGADLSKYNGEVDFVTLKQSGVSFVMLRLGMRGYGSGEIMLDEKFTDYITKASEAGLDIGIYFYSQALTEEEAAEEANFVIQNLANYQVTITYPVAFDMEYVPNDTARVEALNREEKTKVAKVFLDTVKNAGYKPMVYGTKEWLLKQMDLTKLTDYDIWLSQQEEVPDYPYKFQIWQYTREGSLAGADGDVHLNISFVDYSEK